VQTSEQLRVNELCRKHRIGFISADVRGLMAGCFVDLGDLFVCSDATGEAPITKLIASITQAPNYSLHFLQAFLVIIVAFI
jgi:molybdopterin/thiamine biosynthesis adenylyltransferase